LIDDWELMADRSWIETGRAFETIAHICTQRGADGINVYFLDHIEFSPYRNVILLAPSSSSS
jgi:hypothetical protein